ncbi:hypothetical protein QRD43_20810 [Pelomonas sp. APW6]|uniref:Uncharacterized protein n=1 Tax=Roseateles subflavus TaxID=3053353 RepID=A0ABT7LNA1_9BURK|nr:hypothetical protein [Pelomonas sp. APW6]MDL5034356.1 hypothetical protein [Pelomonas sp. APW6]
MTIGDFVEVQRKAMEASLATKAGGVSPGGQTAVPAPTGAAPIAVVSTARAPASDAGAASAPVRPVRPPEPTVAVSGVARFGGQWYAEVQMATGSVLKKSGERIAGTPWTVSAIYPSGATLVRPGTADDLAEEAGGKKAGQAKGRASDLKGSYAPVVRRFTFEKSAL